MSTASAAAVPARLQELFARWVAGGRQSQGGIGWSRRTWQDTLPEHQPLLAELPDRVDRATVARYGAHAARDDEQAVRAFVAAMVWGYGRTGYGAFRTARVLRENPDAPAVLRQAAERVGRDGGAAAFAWLSRNRLRYLGVAFATKYLFHCSGPDAPPALVLDRLVQRWLRQQAAVHLRLTWHVVDYRRYLELTTGWAAALGATPAEVEYLMFGDAAAGEPGSQWSPSSTTPGNPPDGEATAVLDALDDAANAFAALPGDTDPADLEDFDRALRQLRRIVLARVPVASTAHPEAG